MFSPIWKQKCRSSRSATIDPDVIKEINSYDFCVMIESVEFQVHHVRDKRLKSFGGKLQIRQLMADGITISAATLTAPSKLGTDGGIVAPTEMRFVPPAKEAKGYPKEAENKRGGAIIHIGKMIRTSLPPAIVSHLKMSLNSQGKLQNQLFSSY
ncbi:hypothetical protein C8J56DRAFT_887131 [Mycena floridula]|nr:hypothetical protein C8J56DRAFT_887131 [Mycena floridula]